jgi:hypothetical protein
MRARLLWDVAAAGLPAASTGHPVSLAEPLRFRRKADARRAPGSGARFRRQVPAPGSGANGLVVPALSLFEQRSLNS